MILELNNHGPPVLKSPYTAPQPTVRDASVIISNEGGSLLIGDSIHSMLLYHHFKLICLAIQIHVESNYYNDLKYSGF